MQTSGRRYNVGIMDVELRHLRSFLAVAEELHFGRAADRLHVAQPALSRQLRGLERELGAELFDRRSRPIALTSAGAAFLEEARLTVVQARHAVETGRRAARGEVGHLSVDTTFWAYTAIVPAVLRTFRDHTPGVSVALSTAHGPTKQIEALQQQRVDVCFTAFAQWIVGRSALEVEPLLEEPMMAIVATDHPFAGRAGVGLEELAGEPLVALAHAIVPGLIDRQLAMFHARGLSPTQVQEAPDPLALFSLIGARVGIGLHMASFSTLCPPGVVFVPITGEAPTAELLLVWRRDDERETVRAFIDAARAVARSRDLPPVLRRAQTGSKKAPSAAEADA